MIQTCVDERQQEVGIFKFRVRGNQSADQAKLFSERHQFGEVSAKGGFSAKKDHMGDASVEELGKQRFPILGRELIRRKLFGFGIGETAVS